MTPQDVPEEAKRLLADHITSVEQLEILLLLRRRPEGVWTPQTVAQELRTSESSASKRLAALRARGLVAMDDGEGVFRYRPANERLGRSVDSLADAYAERPYRVIELIFSKPIDDLRVYADAFRLRKEDSDG
jgi:predicted transcriptional regulator